jgi:hypothetical protein
MFFKLIIRMCFGILISGMKEKGPGKSPALGVLFVIMGARR